MKALFVASECAPFVKTGGLADVIGALPKSLSDLDCDVRVMLPGYPALKSVADAGETRLRIDNLFGGPARVISARAEGLNLLLLDAPHLFDRSGSIYLDDIGQDWHDNHLRFGALCQIAAKIAIEGIDGWKPDLVNAHDWQAGLVPAYLKQHDGPTPPCVLTIHNIAFQGVFDAGILGILGLSQGLYSSEGMEYYGKLSFLKAGIAFSDQITTVSPTYARELMTPEFGMGLEGIIQARRNDVTGILNGIDLDTWNPETDHTLPATYSRRSLKGKGICREEIERRFGLKHDPQAPIFCVVSRLTEQKGLDLLLQALPALVDRGARLVVLGSGERYLEDGFIGAAHRYAGSVGTIIGYDEPLSHLMQGGSDAILIPSRFEPCGLTQLYGLRYGTIPVVARTGGLADTVIDANAAAIAADCATGVQFAPITATSLAQAIDRTCTLFQQSGEWSKMMRRAMKHPVGWGQSAHSYLDLYGAAIDAHGA